MVTLNVLFTGFFVTSFLRMTGVVFFCAKGQISYSIIMKLGGDIGHDLVQQSVAAVFFHIADQNFMERQLFVAWDGIAYPGWPSRR